jgi:hypothetical protein
VKLSVPGVTVGEVEVGFTAGEVVGDVGITDLGDGLNGLELGGAL